MGSKYLGIARTLALVAALAAMAMVLTCGPGTRMEAWSWQTGLGMLIWAFYLGAAAAVVSLVLVVLLAIPRFRARPWVPVASLAIALAAIAPPLMMLSVDKSVPRIHDITTDTANPPAFVGLLEVRRKASNGFAYGGEAIAAEQRKAYPDLKALVLKSPPRETVQRAIDAARSLGWEVVASDAEAGRIEATDTTMWFGFKDDIVIRIQPDPEGSRVDVRSVSRVGLSDLGANAKRIRAFLGKLS
jgi:uncharacterized protein (DUF1499 family)